MKIPYELVSKNHELASKHAEQFGDGWVKNTNIHTAFISGFEACFKELEPLIEALMICRHKSTLKVDEDSFRIYKVANDALKKVEIE